jgi:dUTP pyrophosphatase
MRPSAPLDLQFARLPHADGLPVPSRQTEGAAGYDIVSAVDLTFGSMERKLVPTGFCIAIPAGYECQIRPRSGLAYKHGMTLPNTPATIDSDYRGEIQVPMVNLDREPFTVTRGMRIAQLVFAKVEVAEFREVRQLPPTDRGAGGFGSTGK